MGLNVIVPENPNKKQLDISMKTVTTTEAIV
jgi:hypothetical protein